MIMKRRTFLQRIGSILTVLGVTEAEWLTLSNRYYQALAAPSPRKLGLLIGINKYPQSPALSGCLTDVELQKELLIHRFGFQGSDILTLTDEQATPEAIASAFLEHLGKQAKSGDVVIFHFSGYGTRVKLGMLPSTTQNALLLANENPKTPNSQNDKIVNYLLEETLMRLWRSLPTDRATAVLDTSYYAPSTIVPTGCRIRALPEREAQLASAELDLLQQFKTENLLDNLVLTATSDAQQLAPEALLSGFSAGLFTYALTQYLWEAIPATTIQFSLVQVENTLYKLGSRQQPGLISGRKNPQSVLLGDNFQPNNSNVACGVIIATEEDGKTVQLWLGGLPPQVLEYYGVNSRFTLVTGEQLILRSRTGLTAKAQISNLDDIISLQVGQLVSEAVRVLPRNIGLTVALGTGLERIERVDATSAFATVSHVATVVAGEQPADYVFGRVLQRPSNYGLFSLGGELIPNTTGEMGEAVKVAVQRLAPKLPTLLATKLWRLTDNAGSSGLPVKGTLEIIQGISSRPVIKQETVRPVNSDTAIKKSLNTAIVPIGSRIQYRVENLGDRPVYLILLGLRSGSIAIALYPWQSHQEANIQEPLPLLQQIVIAPGQTLTIPKTGATSGWLIPGPAYEYEHQLIFSIAPFTETLSALETAKNRTADQQPIGPLFNPLEVTQALLQDLHNASAVNAENNGTDADSYILDVNNWASLNFTFQVV